MKIRDEYMYEITNGTIAELVVIVEDIDESVRSTNLTLHSDWSSE